MLFYFVIMSNKSISGKNLEHALTSEDFLGKRVIDSAGRIIGVSDKVFIDSQTLTFLGISVDKGLMFKGIVIGKGYIDKITKHAIFLKVPVAFEMKGMSVFDSTGKKIGTVSEVNLHGTRNSIKELRVTGGFLRRKYMIPSSAIAHVGDNVMLSVTKKQLVRQNKPTK